MQQIIFHKFINEAPNRFWLKLKAVEGIKTSCQIKWEGWRWRRNRLIFFSPISLVRQPQTNYERHLFGKGEHKLLLSLISWKAHLWWMSWALPNVLINLNRHKYRRKIHLFCIWS